MNVGVWSAERIEKLCELAPTNSARAIAAILGEGVTRNAVIGKAHRLGIVIGAGSVAPNGGGARPRPALRQDRDGGAGAKRMAPASSRLTGSLVSGASRAAAPARPEFCAYERVAGDPALAALARKTVRNGRLARERRGARGVHFEGEEKLMGSIAFMPPRDASPLTRIARGEVLARAESAIDWRTPDGAPLTLASLRAHYAAVRARLEGRGGEVVNLPLPPPTPRALDAPPTPPAPPPRALDAPPEGAPRIGRVIAAAAEIFDVSIAAILGARKTAHVVWPRQAAMYVARLCTGKTLAEIGSRFGGRDHTTVLHALRAVPARMAAFPSYAAEVERLTLLVTRSDGLRRATVKAPAHEL